MIKLAPLTHTAQTILTIGTLLLLSGCQTNPLIAPVQVPQPQRAEVYVANSDSQVALMPREQQQAAARQYLEKYFTPWNNQRDFRYFDHARHINIVRAQQGELNALMRKSSWGSNYQPRSKTWFAYIKSQMNLENYPNRNQRAIVVRDTALRALPTHEPVFNDFRLPGEGFPFDNLQYSGLWVGTPLHVAHLSRDGAWALVIGPRTFGWVETDAIAYASDRFVAEWQTGKYVATLKNHAPVRDEGGTYRFDARLGSLFPRKKDRVLIPVKDLNNNALIKTTSFNPSSFVEFPAAVTPARMTALMNELLGEPYGWGGLYGYRDCSQTLMDIFTPVGIWLPRNSAAQLRSYPHLSIANMKAKQKQQYLAQQTKPMLTLVGLPGHIMLYIGQKRGQAMIFHDLWGLRTKDFTGNAGRAVVGQVVITPLDFGANIPHVNNTLLDSITTVTFLDRTA